MKKIFVLIILILVFVIGCKKDTFTLDEEYYNNSEIIEIDKSEFDKLVENKKSFAVFIYESTCVTSDEFSEVLNEFSNKNQISLYKMSFENMKNTELNNKIKFYPSLAIFNKGKLIDYLDAESDEDKEYYKNVDGLENWFFSYVSKNAIR